MTTFSAEAALVCEALEIDAVREFSRDPLGDGTVVGFHVDADGQTLAVYVDTSGIAVDAETGLVYDDHTRLWTHPADPHLPALAAVAFGSAAQTLLGRLHIAGVQQPEIVAYRPGRRAVLKTQTDEGVVWIKVVRPRHVERIVDAHRALRDAGVEVPRVRAWSPTGLLVIDAAEGTPATHAPWTAQSLVDAVDDLRSRISATPTTRPARSAVLTRVDWYARRACALSDELGDRAERIARRIRHTPTSTQTTVHGDLHFGQLFMNPEATTITGVIDVDTLGLGDAAEDPAAFISHAIASAALAADDSPVEVTQRLHQLVVEADTRWAGEAVCGRVAAHLLGHLTAAADNAQWERAERLMTQAESWAQRVAAPDEEPEI